MTARSRFAATCAKLAVFVAAALFCTLVVANTLDPPLRGASKSYSAVFSDATGVLHGTEVRVAGVRVGKVDSVRLAGGDDGPGSQASGAATVRFEAEAGQSIPADGRAVIRYADLLGARYIAILPGKSAGPGTQPLPDGAEIPVSRTQPALDLTALLNGFKPLFDVMDPHEVNQFAREIVAVLQGESGTITDLLNRTVSVTRNLGSQRDVISEVVHNLGSVMDLALRHRDDFNQLIGGMARLANGLVQDRQQVMGALDSGAALTRRVAGLLDELQPQLDPALHEARSLTTAFVHNTVPFVQTLQAVPPFVDTLNRTTDYGSWLNVYICNLKLRFSAGTLDLSAGPHSEVCRR